MTAPRFYLVDDLTADAIVRLAGLAITSAGQANLDAALHVLNAMRTPVTPETLAALAATQEKQP